MDPAIVQGPSSRQRAVLARYEAAVSEGRLQPDPAQQRAAARLALLAEALAVRSRARWPSWPCKPHRKRPLARGVYLWGGVGRGKSMLMDLLVSEVPAARTRRVHFHAFMLDIHRRLADARRRQTADPLRRLAEETSSTVDLLAFDEVIIVDPADALILSRLFQILTEDGVAIVATSNFAPDQLDAQGLFGAPMRDFVQWVADSLDVVAMDGPVDYRFGLELGYPTWRVLDGTAARRALDQAFQDFAAASGPLDASAPMTLEVPGGRTLAIPEARNGVARAPFDLLCGQARGAADYLALAERFHTVILDGVPVFAAYMGQEAARFRTLVDTLYEHDVRLVVSATAPPEALYQRRDGGAFQFRRTISRLREMSSVGYLRAGRRGL
jgi:cell division protein ZapE